MILSFSYSQADTLELAGESENKPHIKPHGDTLEFYVLSVFISVWNASHVVIHQISLIHCSVRSIIKAACQLMKDCREGSSRVSSLLRDCSSILNPWSKWTARWRTGTTSKGMTIKRNKKHLYTHTRAGHKHNTGGHRKGWEIKW